MDANEKRQLHDIEVEALYAEAVQVNPDFIEADLGRVAADLAYFSEKYADAVLAHGEAEIARKQTAAKLNIMHRETLLANAEEDSKGKRKAPTVDAVNAAVESDARFLDATRAVLNAEVAMVRARGRVEAVRVKKDAIVQIASTRRAEMGFDPSQMRAHQAAQDAQRMHGTQPRF